MARQATRINYLTHREASEDLLTKLRARLRRLGLLHNVDVQFGESKAALA